MYAVFVMSMIEYSNLKKIKKFYINMNFQNHGGVRVTAVMRYWGIVFTFVYIEGV